MFSRLLQTFGRQFTLSDLLAFGAFVVGAIVTLLDLVGIWDKLAIRPIGVVTLLLITALILYSIQEKWELVRRNAELQLVVQSYGTITMKIGEVDTFNSAIEQVQSNRFDVVRIFAPVGVWQASDIKKKWFQTLSEALDPTHQTITELRAVFGMPPSLEAFEQVARPELASFNGKDAARLRFLPPPTGIYPQLPGTGVLILGSNAIGFGFAVHGHHTVVDSVVFVQKSEVVKEVTLWFDGVWEAARDHQLKEARHNISLDQGLAAARQSCYNA